MSFFKKLGKTLIKGIQEIGGAAFPWGEVASAGAGLLGSIFGNKSSKKAQESANQTNLQIAQMNNDANRAIADATNAMNLKIMRENNAWSAEQALKMFNLENQYNSPAAQMQRLAFAGLNPSVAMAGSLGSAMSTPANGSAPVGQPIPAVTGAPMQAAHVEPVYNRSSTLESFNSVASLLSSVSSAFKNTAEGKSIMKKMTAELDNILADTAFTRVQQQRQTIQLQLDKIFANLERKSGLRKLDNEARKLFNEAMLAKLKGDTEKWNTKVAEFESTLRDAESKLSGEKLEAFREQRPVLLENLRKEGALIDEKINTEKSQQESNRASAQVSYAQAKQIRETLQDIKDTYKEDIKNKKFERVKYALEKKFQALGIGQNPLNRIFSRIISDDVDFNVSAGEILDWINDNSDR